MSNIDKQAANKELTALKERIKALEGIINAPERNDDKGDFVTNNNYYFLNGALNVEWNRAGNTHKVAALNSFSTLEAANRRAKYLKAMAKLKSQPGVCKFATKSHGWALCCQQGTAKTYCVNNFDNQYLGWVYFDSKESAENALKAMGDDIYTIFNYEAE